MPFTPNEIKNKEFSRVKNGLEPTEVANFLEQLSTEIERLKEDKKQLEKVIEERDTNIKSYQDVHQSVSDALIQAQKAIIAKAEAQANQMVGDAVEKARRLAFQTEDMKRQSKVFRSRFRMLVEAQLDLLKNEDWDYLLNYDLDAEQVTLENIHHLHENDLKPDEVAANAQNNASNTPDNNQQSNDSETTKK